MPVSDEAIKLRAKYKCFRALVLGRANAGKTTILKAVCNSTENPRIYNSNGDELDESIIAPTSERGEHDINNELRFSSNEGFVFHDSRGFEAGSVREVEIMKQFIEERTNANTIDKQLHAIWYCIPVDNARLLTAAELEFFDKCDPRGVPVVVVFTKFDSRDAAAYEKLLSEGRSSEEAEFKFQQVAEDEFRKDELPRILNRKFPPTTTVFLRDMNTQGANCAELIEQTTGALDTDALKMLLVSVQRTNLKLCVKSVLEYDGLYSCLKGAATVERLEEGSLQELVKLTINWFPHTWEMWEDFEYEDDGGDYIDVDRDRYVDVIKPHLPKLTEFCWPPVNCHTLVLLRSFSLCCAIVINLEHSSFMQKDQPPHLKFRDSLLHYVQSNTLVKVQKAISDMAADICADLSCSGHYPLPHPPSSLSSPPPPSSPVPPPSPLRKNRPSKLLSKLLRRLRTRVVPGAEQPRITAVSPPSVSPSPVSENMEQPHIISSPPQLGSMKQPPCHAGRAFTQDDVIKLYPIVVDNFLLRPLTS